MIERGAVTNASLFSIAMQWKSLKIYAERARIETPCDFKSMHSRVMTWQPHHLGHALPPPPKGRDGSEDTQVE